MEVVHAHEPLQRGADPGKLRKAEKLQAQGLTIPQACKRLGIRNQNRLRLAAKDGVASPRHPDQLTRSGYLRSGSLRRPSRSETWRSSLIPCYGAARRRSAPSAYEPIQAATTTNDQKAAISAFPTRPASPILRSRRSEPTASATSAEAKPATQAIALMNSAGPGLPLRHCT